MSQISDLSLRIEAQMSREVEVIQLTSSWSLQSHSSYDMRFETLTADPSAPIRLTYTEKLVSVLNNPSCPALTGWHLEAESYFRKGATWLARSALMVIGVRYQWERLRDRLAFLLQAYIPDIAFVGNQYQNPGWDLIFHSLANKGGWLHMTVKELDYLRERLRPTLSYLFIGNFDFDIILKRRYQSFQTFFSVWTSK